MTLPFIYRVVLEMKNTDGEVRYPLLRVHKDDTSAHVLKLIPVCGGEPFLIPETAVVTLYAKSSDGTVFFSDCTLSDGVIEHVFTSSELSREGILECEIHVLGDGETFTSPKFTVEVCDVLRNDSAIEATDSFSALDKALSKVRDFDTRISEKADKVIPEEAGNVATLSADGGLRDAGIGIETLKKLCEKSKIPVITVTSVQKKTFYGVSDTDVIDDGQLVLLYYDIDSETKISSANYSVSDADGNFMFKASSERYSRSCLYNPMDVHLAFYYDGAFIFASEQPADNIYFDGYSLGMSAATVFDGIAEVHSESQKKTDILIGTSAPVGVAASYIGQFYTDKASGKLYQCTDIINGVSSWISLS